MHNRPVYANTANWKNDLVAKKKDFLGELMFWQQNSLKVKSPGTLRLVERAKHPRNLTYSTILLSPDEPEFLLCDVYLINILCKCVSVTKQFMSDEAIHLYFSQE
jgi:hypothetical protein